MQDEIDTNEMFNFTLHLYYSDCLYCSPSLGCSAREVIKITLSATLPDR